MLVEPGAEQGRDLVGQPHRQIEDELRAGLGRGLDDRLELMVGDARITGAMPTPTGTPASARRFTAARRLRAAGARGSRVREISGGQRGHRQGDAGEPLPAHPFEDVEVGEHAVRLGGDRHRVAGLGEHLEQERVIRHFASIGW